ncbi:protein GLUTAMINE DUMPER 5-like [Nicotiana tomentosiformis]|uniref:protein GLUTAMINE DUMPER 5-like n=1 Tax=Nicotiana tomentosiformis TaxID=4098 RepID=UPI00051B4E97|nr:protein GLUTAMINE DUMPER 5-like [Nicotiana tomentosiformis]
MTNLESSSSAISPVGPPRSPWHSPVPYLFGGLAAMLGLIAFALLILACSYWRLSGYLENNEGENGDDLEAGEGNNNGNGSDVKVAPPVFEEKFLVIMAGEMNPTFIATPISSRVSSFGSSSSGCTTSSESGTEKLEGEEEGEKKQENGVSSLSLENIESAPNMER